MMTQEEFEIDAMIYDDYKSWTEEYSRICLIINGLECEADDRFENVYFLSGWKPIDAFIEQKYRHAIDNNEIVLFLKETLGYV